MFYARHDLDMPCVYVSEKKRYVYIHGGEACRTKLKKAIHIPSTQLIVVIIISLVEFFYVMLSITIIRIDLTHLKIYSERIFLWQ